MKLADIETLIWLIIAAVVLIAKGWGKLQGQIDKDSSESTEAPPVKPARPKLQSPQSRRPSGTAPPLARPSASPTPRGAQPAQPTAPRTAPTPVGSPPPREAWRVDPEQIRRFMEQLSGHAPPAPPPIAHPPVHKAEAPAPSHATPAKPEHTPVAPATAPAIASAPAAAPSRASLWVEALRDRQNIRNIIISAEIIGPPKAM